MTDFKPTHVITLTDEDGAVVEVTEVMVDKGSAYDREEWDACAQADWCVTESGEWRFQGRSTPRPGLEVTVTQQRVDAAG